MKILNQNDIKKYVERVPQIPFEEIKVLYANDYHDGPLEGLCLWKEKEYYFLWHGGVDSNDEIDRKFLLIQLSPSQIEKDKQYHKDFLEKKSAGRLDEFYAEQEKESGTTIEENQIIGWFEGWLRGHEPS